MALLTRYAKKIALAYDVDPAGEKAGTFGVQALEALIGQLAADDTGVELDEVRVVRLPDGKDPDEVLREAPDRWREEVRTAQPIVDHLIDFHARQVDLKTPGGKARFVDAVAADHPGDPESGDARRLPPARPQVTGVEERSLLEARHRPAPAPGGAIHGGAGSASTRSSPRPIRCRSTEILRAITPLEAELLRLLLLVPDQQARIADEIGPDLLPCTPARELYRAIVLQRAPNDQGVRPPFARPAPGRPRRRDRAPSPRRSSPSRRPDRATSRVGADLYAVENLLLELEADRSTNAADCQAMRARRGRGRGDTARSIGELVALRAARTSTKPAVDRVDRHDRD